MLRRRIHDGWLITAIADRQWAAATTQVSFKKKNNNNQSLHLLQIQTKYVVKEIYKMGRTDLPIHNINEMKYSYITFTFLSRKSREPSKPFLPQVLRFQFCLIFGPKSVPTWSKYIRYIFHLLKQQRGPTNTNTKKKEKKEPKILLIILIRCESKFSPGGPRWSVV